METSNLGGIILLKVFVGYISVKSPLHLFLITPIFNKILKKRNAVS